MHHLARGIIAFAWAAFATTIALPSRGDEPAKGPPPPAVQPAPPCAERGAPAACRAEFERRKVSISVRTEVGQDGTRIYYGRFEAGAEEFSYKDFATAFAAETGSDEAEKFRILDVTGLYYAGLIVGGAGIATALAGGVVALASSKESAARDVGWGLLVGGGAALVPATFLVIAGGDPMRNGYSFPVDDAKRLAARYNTALAKRLGCCGESAAAPRNTEGESGRRVGRARERVRIAPTVGFLSVGIIGSF